MKRAENIYLIGFMAAGKSTVGRLLARRLRRPFLDSDAEITRRHGRPADLFKRRGEAHFRRLEAGIVAGICRKKGIVAALGGGAVCLPASARKLRASGRMVYLSAGFDTLWRRGHKKAAGRPLWSSRSGLRALHRARTPVYIKWAATVVRASGAPETVAERIARRIS